ncbi:MAG: DUF6783 domain-containing protein [Ruminococcus sp.]
MKPVKMEAKRSLKITVRTTAKTIITAVMTGTMRNIRECLKISCKCDAHFAESLFQTHSEENIAYFAKKSIKKQN